MIRINPSCLLFTLEHIFSLPRPCPWRKMCDCTWTDMYQVFPTSEGLICQRRKFSGVLPLIEEKTCSSAHELWFLSLLLTGITYVLAQCLYFANKTATIKMIFSTPCTIFQCLFILTSKHLSLNSGTQVTCVCLIIAVIIPPQTKPLTVGYSSNISFMKVFFYWELSLASKKSSI